MRQRSTLPAGTREGRVVTPDRYGERIEDDDALVAFSDALLDFATEYVPRSPEEIRQHCADLRAILRDTRAIPPPPETRTTPEQMTSAAARSAALLRQLDTNRSQGDDPR